MFLKYIKTIFIKKTLKNNLSNVKEDALNGHVKTVGLFVDESYFEKKDALIDEIIGHGILAENIEVIVYRDTLKSKESYSKPTFGLKDLSFKGQFTNESINRFVSEEFDLLINYYDEEKPFLLLLTHNSRAKFKVGFSSVDKRLNHLMVKTDLQNYKVFIQELFRYLKILNKI